MHLLATAWYSHYNVEHCVSEQLNKQLNASSVSRTEANRQLNDKALTCFQGSRDLLFWTCALSVARDEIIHFRLRGAFRGHL